MDNVDIYKAKFQKVERIPGTITGLEIVDDNYYIIAHNFLFQLTQNGDVLTPLEHKPILRGMVFNKHEQQLFACDGYNFYYWNKDRINVIKINSKIVAAKYSPLQDKLVYVDANNFVVLCDINPKTKEIVEEMRWSLRDKVPVPLNVQWGASHTQFMGFDNATYVDIIRNADGLICMEAAPEIIWGPEGKYFLVSYLDNKNRCFSVFSVFAGLISRNEYIPGLQTPISWRVNPSIITMACCSDGVWKIIVYEQNGYAKDVIMLPSNTPIEQLTWSPDGNILAILQQGRDECNVTLMTVQGLVFEIKKKITFHRTVRYIQWRNSKEEDPYLVVVTDESIIHYFLRYTISVSAMGLHQGTHVGVIRGRSLAIFDFEKYFGTLNPLNVNNDNFSRNNFSDNELPADQNFRRVIEFTNEISQVVFNTNMESVLCIDSKGFCYTFGYTGSVSAPSIITKESKFPIKANYSQQVHHIAFIGLKILCYYTDGEVSKECRYNLFTNNYTITDIVRKDMTGLKVTRNFKTNALEEFTFYENGDLYLGGIPHFKYKNGITKVDKLYYYDMDYLLVLDNFKNLYCNHALLSRNVSSFFIFNNYVAFSTLESKLYVARWNVFDKSMKENLGLTSFDCTPISDGSILTVALPVRLEVLLQSPTRYVEAIPTNLLGIDLINRLLDRGDWHKAIKEIKVRHLNSNILIDTDIERFLRNVDNFINNYVIANLFDFVLNLNDDNFLQMLPCASHFDYIVNIPNKVATVCAKLVEVMAKLDIRKYIEVIMVAKVKGEGLDGAINYIATLHNTDKLEGSNNIIQRGLFAICRYWKQEDVIAACLRTYDIDFSLFAHFTNKYDPQVTSMIFEELIKSDSEPMKRFKVSHYLKDYKSATRYIAVHTVVCGNIVNEEKYYHNIIEYALNHQTIDVLYNSLNKIGIYNERVWLEYARVLEAEDNKKKAASIYEAVGDLNTAYSLYVSSYLWEDAVKILDLMKLEENERSNRLTLLANHLSASGLHSASRQIYLMLQNYPEAIRSAIRQRSFREGIDLTLKNCLEMLPEFRTEFFEYEESIEALINKTREEVYHYALRVDEIRLARRTQAEHIVEEGPNNYGVEYAESTQTGASTNKTGSSRKSKKEQRRYTDLKVGGTYEDIAIMRAVHCKITEMGKLDEEMLDLVTTSMILNDKERAERLIHIYNTMITVFQKYVPVMWIDGLNNEKVSNDELMYARKNFEFLDDRYKTPPIVAKPINENVCEVKKEM